MILHPGNMWAIRIKVPNLIFCKNLCNGFFLKQDRPRSSVLRFSGKVFHK